MIDYPDHQHLISELAPFPNRRDLESSPEFRKYRTYLTELLGAPHFDSAEAREHRLGEFLRVAHWNIEKGKYLSDIVKAFLEDPILRSADLISINEADAGMNRSGHRFVARELAAALNMNFAFAPCYLEFSKGYGDDLDLPGQNTSALQGNAILSTYPIRNARIIELPLCHDHFDHAEKRIGNRNALCAEIELPGMNLIFVSTHLEVRNAPRCRSKQIAAILDTVDAARSTGPALIAGDFNSNTFARGGALTTFKGFMRLMLSNADRLRASIAHPQEREPLFEVARRHRFAEQGFNDHAVTCYVPMKILEDSGTLPGFLSSAINRQMARYNGRLDFRLDWMLGRDLTVLMDYEVTDAASGKASRGATTLPGLRKADGNRISDHDPITVDLRFSN